MENVKEWLKFETGAGYGYGYGSGYGDGHLSSINKKSVYLIDKVPTIILSIHMALAKGFILNSDLTMTPCYVVKGNGCFAHGKTPREAQEALRKKMLENMDTDEAIDKFCETFKAAKSSKI